MCIIHKMRAVFALVYKYFIISLLSKNRSFKNKHSRNYKEMNKEYLIIIANDVRLRRRYI